MTRSVDPSYNTSIWYAADVCVMVRDARIGCIVVQPPKHLWWLVREKIGLGRASKASWNVVSEVGDQMFEQLGGSMYSDYVFGFEDHYDVIVWDTLPGAHFHQLHHTVHTALVKAHRFKSNFNYYRPAESILRTLHCDKENGRCRDLRPDETSIWDDLIHQGSYMINQITDNFGERCDMTEEELYDAHYNEVDAIEDEILFPEEREGYQHRNRWSRPQ